jgi:type IV secretion system protein VirD4
LVAAALAPPVGDDAVEDDVIEEGGAQQAKEPELAETAAVRADPPRPANPLNLDEDDNPAADKRLMDRVRPLAPVLAAHAMDEAASRSGDQLGLGL